MTRNAFPHPDARRRTSVTADLVILLGVGAALTVLVRVGAGAFVPFRPPGTVPALSLDAVELPWYALRSTLRMFVALAFSTLFALAYGYAAAHSRRAARVLVPLLDVLQSVPVLGYLSVTVGFFLMLFPGRLLGLEAASVFAIFTSQAWNMTFSFYHSLQTIPRDLDDAARLLRLSLWQRFTNVEWPSAAIPFVWNAMMSFGGGWFFVTASEAITVLGHTYALPGLGSYVALAIERRDAGAIALALATIAVVVVLVDQLFWRPILTLTSRYRFERGAAADRPTSWVIDLWRRSHLPHMLEGWRARLLPVGRVRPTPLLVPGRRPPPARARPDRGGRLIDALLATALGVLAIVGGRYLVASLPPAAFLTALELGLLTLARVAAVLLLGSLVWTPIGVLIGFHPRLSRALQPVVQLLAAFPANFLFPFAILAFLYLGISIGWGSILLMALGSQWYILFNTIAGASAIPGDLREMTSAYGVTRRTLWTRLILPGIFPTWITGAVTAAGGAWNASIISEIVTWGPHTYTAEGLGAYITRATEAGDWPRIALGVVTMSLLVVLINRLVWQRLYRYAERRFRLA